MGMTLQLLKWVMRKDLNIKPLAGFDPYYYFTDVLFWDGKAPLKDMLYLKSHTSPVPNMTPDSTPAFHVAEEALVPELVTQRGLYVSCPKGEVAATCNIIHRAVILFNRWYNDTLFMASKALPPQAFIDNWDSYYKIPMSVIDRSFRVIAESKNYNIQFPNLNGGLLNKQMDFQDIQDLLIDDVNFNDTYNQRGLQRYTKRSDARRKMLYYNIFRDGEYAARVLMSVPAEDDTDGVEILLNEACVLLMDIYLRHYESQIREKNKDSLVHNIRKLLDGEQVSPEEMALAARCEGWQLENMYCVYYLLPDQNAASKINLDYFCERIHTTYPTAFGVQNGNHICLIRNCSQQDKTGGFDNSLAIFLRDMLFHAGISREFAGLYNLTRYHRQAQTALTLGTEKNPEQWIWHFDDLSLEYALWKAIEEYPASDILHPAIRRLREYDSEHESSELENTLYMHLKNNGNITDSAEALRIHRTTFLYRMRKIEQLTRLDLENWDTRLALMLSYSLNPAYRKQ